MNETDQIEITKSLEEQQKEVDEENRQMDTWSYLLLKTSIIPLFISVIGLFLVTVAFLNLHGAEILENLQSWVEQYVFMDFVFFFGGSLVIIGILLEGLRKRIVSK